MKLSNKMYDILKWVCLVLIPAVNVLLSVLDKAWGWGLPVEQIITSTSAVAAFLGAIIGFSTAQYNKEDK